MIRVAICIFEMILFFLLQTSVFSNISFSNEVPDLMLILVIATAYTRGRKKGAVVGFCAGLLLDIYFSDIIGFCALLYVLIGYFAGYFHKIYSYRDVLLCLGMIFGGEFAFSFIYYISRFVLRGRLMFGTYLLYTILPRVIYTGLVGMVLFPLLIFIHEYLKRHNK